MITEDVVRSALRTVIDPELGFNIVDLGLIYNIHIDSSSHASSLVSITMTLTTPGCPLGPFFLNQVKEVVAMAAQIQPEAVDVQIIFDPPWSQDMMSDELKLQMGI